MTSKVSFSIFVSLLFLFSHLSFKCFPFLFRRSFSHSPYSSMRFAPHSLPFSPISTIISFMCFAYQTLPLPRHPIY